MGNGNSLQYCCLENPMDRGAWGVTVHGVAKSRSTTHTEGRAQGWEGRARRFLIVITFLA